MGRNETIVSSGLTAPPPLLSLLLDAEGGRRESDSDVCERACKLLLLGLRKKLLLLPGRAKYWLDQNGRR